MPKPWYLRSSFLIFVLSILSLFFFITIASKPSRIAVVSRVIDGDSLQLVGGLQVRLIGVDTPEYHDQERNIKNASQRGIEPRLYQMYAEEASNFVKELALHQSIRLEYDEMNQGSRHRDRHGRILAYVWMESPFSGKIPEWAVLDPQAPDAYKFSLNASLIKAGYALTKTGYSFKRLVAYKTYEQDAKTHKRGFWRGS